MCVCAVHCCIYCLRGEELLGFESNTTPKGISLYQLVEPEDIATLAKLHGESAIKHGLVVAPMTCPFGYSLEPGRISQLLFPDSLLWRRLHPRADFRITHSQTEGKTELQLYHAMLRSDQVRSVSRKIVGFLTQFIV